MKVAAPANGSAGPTSQIPGLSQSATESSLTERSTGRRVGIFATDSDYVKLAKQGGHQGLLSHDDVDVDAKPKMSYNPPEWFSASKSGGKATSPDESAARAGRQLAAPFGTDSASSWDKEDHSLSPCHDKGSPEEAAAGQLEGLVIVEPHKYKRTCYDKKTPPVSMSKLLSFGYMEEEEKKNPNDDDASSVTSEQTSTIATEEVEQDDLE
ncbi:hypothetical protein NHX12_015234 [Muraenolepis orangiensis]|uniref:Uncharacterized protein n=1 Tax=Muraenolepis orangiensis TaxID=630683 RepID=A0A9Q0I3N8_9TELE|nr:hypothetical protein NHX12_015234 [Muraenolepis orangiensis]